MLMPPCLLELLKVSGGRRLFCFPAPETPANCRDTKNHLTYGNGGIFMNTLVIVVIAACCLAAGYLLYGRWLCP